MFCQNAFYFESHCCHIERDDHDFVSICMGLWRRCIKYPGLVACSYTNPVWSTATGRSYCLPSCVWQNGISRNEPPAHQCIVFTGPRCAFALLPPATAGVRRVNCHLQVSRDASSAASLSARITSGPVEPPPRLALDPPDCPSVRHKLERSLARRRPPRPVEAGVGNDVATWF